MKEKNLHLEMSRSALMHFAMRIAAYTVFIFFFTMSLPFLVQHCDISVFKENGPIEWLQFSLLFCTTSIFLAGAKKFPNFKEMFLFWACFSAFAAVREMDKLLDELIPWIGWKIALIFAVYIVILIIIDRHKIKEQVARVLLSHALDIVWAGFLIAVPVAQLLGDGLFLESILGDDYNRSYKRVIEESGETIGYFLLLVGSAEFIFLMKEARFSQQKQTDHIIISHQLDHSKGSV